jgi:hypothetical protein
MRDIIALDTDPSQARMRYIGKERDEESLLFPNTCPEPLWEKYYSWTPYQYAACNPVSNNS